ncbi:EF-hand domain-containing protein [Mesorhizobium sp. Z1-4]|uniref:EF-hand domain-containing protein n=1 Tax=Mesorhizobium sp. Z1-4 TaxID=2448478 RepID=UPI000FDCC303|nr:EF-hand domain-containing protein [Mesorhizobium sp. Z1-4]
MRKSVKLAIAFATLAGMAGSVAYAKEGPRRHHGPGGFEFERADADNSGDITFEEFAAAMSQRIGFADADANSDGSLTVEEIAAEMQRQRERRRAERMIERFDADGDGVLSLAEIETHQRKVFALMDRNDDGVVAEDELPRRDRGNRERRRRN